VMLMRQPEAYATADARAPVIGAREIVRIDAVHVWRFEPHDGGTFVRTEESFGGLVARFFRRPLRRTLDRALESGLRQLKVEAERRAER
jgi:hypothetical protein